MNRILVIDDEPAVRRALQQILEREGYTVNVAADGAAGLEFLAIQPVDVVITDIIMPVSHGVDTVKAIVRDYPTVAVVAISGGGNFVSATYQPHAIKTDAYLAAAKSAGAHAVLTKPFGTADVLQAITAARTLSSAGHRGH